MTINNNAVNFRNCILQLSRNFTAEKFSNYYAIKTISLGITFGFKYFNFVMQILHLGLYNKPQHEN